MPTLAPPTPLARSQGALLCLACGDALGGPVEFHRRHRFPPVTGMHGGGKFQLRPGEWTDDTAMALCLGESLLACNGMDPRDQMQRYWRWANDGHWSSRPHPFGMGKTVARALMHYRRTGNPLAGPTHPTTAGNGSLMRIAPVAIFHRHDRGSTLAAAALSSRVTHGAPECLAACQYLAALLHACLAGATDKQQVVDAAADIAQQPGLARLHTADFKTATADDVRGSGYVLDCLEAALWAFWHGDTLEQSLLMAANLGDDADTTTAVCGQLAGAFHGAGSIPPAWRSVLHRHDEITRMASDLHHVRHRVTQESAHTAVKPHAPPRISTNARTQ